jgi:hypothetical protein
MIENNFDNYFNNGHLNEDAFALFLDALVLDKVSMLPSIIRSHVEDCQQCKIEVLALYDIMKKNTAIRNAENHPYFDDQMVKGKKTFRIYNLLKIVAGILIIIGIGSLIYTIINQKNSNVLVKNITHTADTINKQKNNNISINSTKKEKDSISKKEKKDRSLKPSPNVALASNMQESELFENLITSYYRSNDVEVTFPPLNHLFNSGQTLVFKINGVLSEPVTLKIYNNQEKKITEKGNISTNSLSITNKLPPGLYYWKLLKGYNLIQAGKFFVK